MSTLNGSAAEPQENLDVPEVGGDTDNWGTILNGTTLQALLNYILWLYARVPSEEVDTSGATEGDVLTLQSDVWVASAPSGGGAEALDDLSDVDTSGASENDLFGLQSGVWRSIANTSDFATAAQGATADAALPRLAVVNSYAGNRTLDSSDSGAYVRITAAGTVTLPDSQSTGYQCVIVNATDSDTVALSAATTLTIPSGFEAEIRNRRAVTVIHVGSNVWEVHGALVETP